MNTLATRHPATTLPEEEVREPAREAARERGRQGSVFVLGSIVLHVGLFLGFSGEESHALVPPASEEVLEIEYQEPAAVVPLPESALPLGALDAEPTRAQPASAPPDAPPESVPQPADQLPTDQLPPSEAPEVLTSDNPYASANAAVFTSGSGKSGGPVASKQAVSAPSFGVSGGKALVDPRKEKELLSWRARVQQELARLATQNYPRRALKLGQQGTAKVTVTIDESGTLVGASLAQGSGVASLDQAALERLQAGARVSAPPAGAGTNRLTLPITFRIN